MSDEEEIKVKEEESENTSDEYKKFIIELIEAYKAHPILWDKKHPDYWKKAVKDEHYYEVYKKYLKYCPEHSMDQMKEKIENLRTCFRRCYVKEQTAKIRNEYYKPNLFYYDTLYFIYGDKDKDPENFNSAEYKKFTLEAIDYYRKHRCLWDKDHPDYWKSPETQVPYQELLAKFREYYPDASYESIKTKIETWRGGVYRQYRKMVEEQKKNINYVPSLFYYDALSFIIEEQYNNTQNHEGYKPFILEFIKEYKKFPALWDKRHPDFSSKSPGRTEAYNELFSKYLKFYPGSTIHQMKEKLENIRTVFRREWHKVQEAKKSNRVCKPKLFYYNQMLFTVDEEEEEEENYPIETDSPPQPEEKLSKSNKFSSSFAWYKEHTTILIELMKKYPETYTECSNKSKKNKAYNALTLDLIARCDKKFKVKEVVRKVKNLKEMYRRYNLRGFKKEMTSELYKQMKEFMPVSSKKKDGKKKKLQMKKKKPKHDQQDSDSDFKNNSDEHESPNNLPEAENVDFLLSKQVKEEEKLDSELAQFRVTIATKLRDMPEDQRQYAEQLISEVMYSGLMEKMRTESSLQF